ncbi:hypothetical protein WMF45_08590 [Sorangium sp. So ce448]|uniref:hypothetical protein n=1 Tax=Sorangium sp. So ce448 TaxID=3133314 RepID=UPI003F616B78
MSYLNQPRLTFSGRFQADPSTVNNDPRHFDNATFTSRFQEFSSQQSLNGWWNPTGTGIFRFAGCTIQQAIGKGGVDPADGAVGFVVGNSPDRPSGKLVDIDPDWQLASQLYGLSVSLRDPRTGDLVLVADFDPTPFRDLWFVRGGQKGDSGASAMWQSQLSNLRWRLAGVTSPVLHALAEASSNSGRLSIRITTFGYQTHVTAADFTYGTVVGAIGPVLSDEPASFVSGRRFMPTSAFQPAALPPNMCVAANMMTCFSGKVIDGALVVDVSNALPIGSDGKLAPLGDLRFALLHDPDANEGAVLAEDQVTVLGALDASDASLTVASGIQTLTLPAAAQDLITKRPLALVQFGGGVPAGHALVMMRETAHGRDVRSDALSFRLDPNASEQNHRDVPLWATRYGLPLADAPLAFQQLAPVPDDGDAPPDPAVGTTPTAAIPIMNSPMGALAIHPQVVRTDAAGRATVRFQGPPTFGRPRRYIDGQLYAVAYNFADEGPIIQQTFDQISVLLFSTFKASENPTWEEVQPIWKQYANLYPIMSKGLFDFSIQEVADANAHILHFVLNKPVTDPDHMPVTRDLSAGKRAALLRYLERVMDRATVHDPKLVARFQGRCPFSGVAPSSPPKEVENQPIFNRVRSR